MRTKIVAKVVSGGQTGADRGDLDPAIELDVSHGGWCPLGRRRVCGGDTPPAPYSRSCSETFSKFFEGPAGRTAVPIDPLLTAEHQLKSPSTEPETSVYQRPSPAPAGFGRAGQAAEVIEPGFGLISV